MNKHSSLTVMGTFSGLLILDNVISADKCVSPRGERTSHYRYVWKIHVCYCSAHTIAVFAVPGFLEA